MEWLRKQAKRRLKVLRDSQVPATLAQAQFDLAKDYGFSSWRELKAHVESLTIDGRLIAAAKNGDAETLAALLDAHPEKLHLRGGEFEWTLLHDGVRHPAVVDLLLMRGIDVNARERGDNTCAMHWAAAEGNLAVVRRLADAGGDVIGDGDDHQAGVIGWATCWPGAQDDAHRAVAAFLTTRGARHHIFSAVALGLADDVRRIVKDDPSALAHRQSRNEHNRTALQFAVAMNLPQMVALLLDLGADPLADDGAGMPTAAYATTPGADALVMRRIHDMTAAEVVSADRGHRLARGTALDLLALAVADWGAAGQLLEANAALIDPRGGVLHLLAKRGDLAAVRWLLAHGADPNARWAHWDSDVTPLHLAILANHPDVVRTLLEAGADPRIQDSKHESDARGWADFFERREIAPLLRQP